MSNILLTLHIAGGTVALLSMPIPLVARKGGRLHRRAGWAFVGGMAVVCVTAIVLSVIRFVTDPTPSGREFAMLLIYIAILTGAGMWAGLRVLRARQRSTRGPWIDIAWAALLTTSGGMAALYGFSSAQPLFIAFSAIGLLNGGSELVYWLRPPTVHMHWWLSHMGNMLGACIAATTAFAIAGGRRIGLPEESLLMWLGPTAIGLPVIFFWVRYYHRRFASRSAEPTTRPAGMTTVATLVVLCAGFTIAPASAQTLAPGTDTDAFDVASVKRNTSGPLVPIPRLLPGGQLQIVGVTLRDLIRMAYPAARGQVLVAGGPAWVTSDRFDITARTTNGVRPSMAMLRRLLEERFRLRVQSMTREGTVFSLVLARRDGRLGPAIQETSCTAAEVEPAVFNDSLERAMRAAQTPATECSTFRIGGGPTFFAENITMGRFAAILSEFPILGNSPVTDHTGLTGTYTFQLRTRADNNPNPDAGALMPAALEEQLGLKLERTTGPVDVIVIESVERAEPD